MNKLSTDKIKEIAVNKVHCSTIYCWIEKFNSEGQITALSRRKKQKQIRLGGDSIINESIANI